MAISNSSSLIIIFKASRRLISRLFKSISIEILKLQVGTWLTLGYIGELKPGNNKLNLLKLGLFFNDYHQIAKILSFLHSWKFYRSFEQLVQNHWGEESNQEAEHLDLKLTITQHTLCWLLSDRIIIVVLIIDLSFYTQQ